MLWFFVFFISAETYKLEKRDDLPGLHWATDATCCCRPSCWRYLWGMIL